VKTFHQLREDYPAAKGSPAALAKQGNFKAAASELSKRAALKRKKKRTNEAVVFKVTGAPPGKRKFGVTDFGMTAAERAAKAATDAEHKAKLGYDTDPENPQPTGQKFKRPNILKDLGKGLPITGLKKARPELPYPAPVVREDYSKDCAFEPAPPKPKVQTPLGKQQADDMTAKHAAIFADRKAATLAFARKHHVIEVHTSTLRQYLDKKTAAAKTFTKVDKASDKEVSEKHIGFKKLEGELGHKGVKNPGALAAYIGRKKYGAKKFNKAAHAGHAVHETRHQGNTPTGKISFKKFKAVVSTNRPIGTRIADIGPGGKESNVKTDAAWSQGGNSSSGKLALKMLAKR
jgi:hypothetical protein